MKSFFRAGSFLLADLFSTFLFVLVFSLTENIYLATGVGVGIGVLQLAFTAVRGKEIDLMQWVSLALVLVFGTTTLATQNPQFIKIKPTLIYIAVGCVMLKPGWMNRYMPPIVNENAPDIPRTFGFIWALMMFVTAIANTVIAFDFDTNTYVWFLGIFPLASKLGLFFIQYIVTRILVRRRFRARLAQIA